MKLPRKNFRTCSKIISSRTGVIRTSSDSLIISSELVESQPILILMKNEEAYCDSKFVLRNVLEN